MSENSEIPKLISPYPNGKLLTGKRQKAVFFEDLSFGIPLGFEDKQAFSLTTNKNRADEPVYIFVLSQFVICFCLYL